MEYGLRETAIDIIGKVSWGTHFCQFYQTKRDLIEILVPYFKSGLENNEFCMWITSEPLNAKDAEIALRKEVANLDDYIKKDQIEILDYTQWYTKSGHFDSDEVLRGWVQKEEQALEKGFGGLRLTGNTFWLEKTDWRGFADYEASVNSIIGKHRMLAFCTYCLDRCTASEIIDVVSNHQFALIKREAKWELIESAEHKQAKEEVRESEEKYKNLVNNSKDLIVQANEEGKFIFVNPAVKDILGYEQEEMIGRSAFDFMHPDDIQTTKTSHTEVINEGRDFWEYENRWQTKNGSTRTLAWNVLPHSDSLGRIVGTQGVARDITERKKAENAQRESEKRLSDQLIELENIYKTSPVGLCFLDTKMRYIRINENMASINGKPIAEHLGQTVWEIVPELAKKAEPDLRAVLQSGEPVLNVEVDGVLPGRPEEKRSWIVNYYPVKSEEGVILGTNVVVQDITELKQAREVLAESERKYRTLFDEALDMIHIVGSDGRIIDANKVELETMGYSREEYVGKPLLEIIHPERRKAAKEVLQEVLEGKAIERYETTLISKDGEQVTVEISAVPNTQDDKVVEARAMMRNITERKAAHAKIENLAKFPSENPNPVLRVAGDGILLYANDASASFLAEWDCRVGQVIPANWRQAVSDALASVSSVKVEAEHKGRVFAFVVAPVAGADYVNLYGRDITERKDMEARQQLAGQILECLNRKNAGVDLIRDVLKLVRKAIGFDAVGIRQREGKDFPYLEVDGFSDDFVKAENYLCCYDETGGLIYDSQGRPVMACMCGNVLSGRVDPTLPFSAEGGSFWTNSSTELLACTSPEALQTPTRNRCNEAGYESIALIPLRSGDEIVGLLQLNDTRRGRFTPEMVRFLEEIGASIGIGMARIKAEQEVENLARFPSENPNPVLRIAKDSTVLYANTAGSELLGNWGCKVGEQAPGHWHQYIVRILESGVSEDHEALCNDRIFSLIMAPVMDAGYANVYGIDITERKQAEEHITKYRHHLEELVQTRTAELTQANEKLLQEIEERRRLEKEILEISERERRRLGQELHDSLGQQLTGVSFLARVVEKKLAARSAEEAPDVAEITKLVKQAIDLARNLAYGMHPVGLEEGGIGPSLQELAGRMEKLFHIRCTFKHDKRIEIDDPSVAVHIYRITQETITNAIKHGKAKNIQVELASKRDEFILTVENDGLDFPEEFEARGTGMGLQIMDHRADIIGASLDIHKAAKGGTIVTCSFPNKTR